MDLSKLIQTLNDCITPEEQEITPLLEKATELLQDQPNIKILHSPITVCGDIHGQLFDLQELFCIGGECPDTNYIFLGDYVDRGHYSVETFLLLLCLYVKYPSRMTLLRGNHEARQTTQAYGFYDECIQKFGNANVWKACTDLFDLFPIAAVIDNEIFCVHGGLSSGIKTLDDINKIDRKCEPPSAGPYCDLLWSDPDSSIEGFTMSPRGAGFLFGGDVVKEFNEQNKISFICRAHQLMMEGYDLMFDETLATIWSAPNYCYRSGNVAAILEFDEKLNKTFKTFEARPENECKSQGQPQPLEYFS
ncbi:serine/threonine-protein phosphatase PP-X isozyme 2 [Histomonas meleagridis]|uniref:serine/threonine-protein phosphatase PP-X isozyme 2 n=1 Tax=Histomonas meleagridis TaxID=135588 RepID=UPI00355A6DC9|nr:serine/threonine-protein phosphatase PP-X isozyme 2 [Histomonas meleagridis]KAH0797100.1 serine/threonine-protein phosphatase PP-X isozyme 2 [Histomonas meleagridis]